VRGLPRFAAILSAALTVLVLPMTVEVAVNALPDSWKPYLGWAWLALVVLAVPAVAIEVRRQRAGRAPSLPDGLPGCATDALEDAGVDVRPGRETQIDSSDAQPNISSQDLRLARRIAQIPYGGPGVVGRDALLADLYEELHGASDDSRGLLRMCVLHGLAGVGKTSLAREYARRHLHEYEKILWVPADDVAAAPQVLICQLDPGYATDERAPRDLVGRAHTLLAALGGAWLLVFDSAEDLASIAHLLPRVGAGHVLVTSRNPYWMSGGPCVPVPTLTIEASIDLLLSAGKSTDRARAELLALELGGLPLALQQAAANIATTPGRTIDSYLRLFKERRGRARLLALGRPPDYPKTVATTWDSNFNALSPEATDLLRLLVSCPVGSIPLAILAYLAALGTSAHYSSSAGFLADEIAMGAALQALAQCSFITISETNDSVAVHRLVRQVVLDRFPTNGRDSWRSVAISLLASTRLGQPADHAVTFFGVDVTNLMDAKGRVHYLLGLWMADREKVDRLLSHLREIRQRAGLFVLENVDAEEVRIYPTSLVAVDLVIADYRWPRLIRFLLFPVRSARTWRWHSQK